MGRIYSRPRTDNLRYTVSSCKCLSTLAAYLANCSEMPPPKLCTVKLLSSIACDMRQGIKNALQKLYLDSRSTDRGVNTHIAPKPDINSQPLCTVPMAGPVVPCHVAGQWLASIPVVGCVICRGYRTEHGVTYGM